MAKKKLLPLANPVPDRFDLIPWGAVCQVARTMTDALKDHDEGGWRNLSRRDHVSRTLRHLALYLSGDTSEEHLEHATCRMLMALDIEPEIKIEYRYLGKETPDWFPLMRKEYPRIYNSNKIEAAIRYGEKKIKKEKETPCTLGTNLCYCKKHRLKKGKK